MSKNLKGKNAFTSLRINRTAEEEIKKYNNNAIHMAYSASKNNNNNNNKNISKNSNQKRPSNGFYEINNNNSNINNKTINNTSIKKDKNNLIYNSDFKAKSKTKTKSGIVINIYSRKTDKDEIFLYDDNYNEEENNYNDDNEQNNSDKDDNLRNKGVINDIDAINVVTNLWMKNNKISNESNFEVFRNIKNESSKNINKNVIMKENNFEIISNKNWANKIREENENFFTIYKTGLKENKYLYKEINYIKDLCNSITLPKDINNELYIINPPNNYELTNKIKYQIIKPKDRNELESQLLEYYTQNKINYNTNIDNNDDIEESKLKPIYVLNKPQINQLYNELNDINEIKEKKIEKSTERKEWGNGNNIFSISKQIGLDYEVIEVFTPAINKDNNTYRTKTDPLNSNDIKENYKSNSQEFGQYTPLSLLNEKFFLYAISRNIKFSVPENQGFINYLNYDKYKRIEYKKEQYQLQKNKFSLKIARTNNKIENMIKKKNNNIIDYSKYSSGDDRNSKK